MKSIGVSNFSKTNLEKLLPHCKVYPVTNQIEVHPCYPQDELIEYCTSKNIVVTAYSPFGQQKRVFFEDEDFINIAKAHNADLGQVAVAWALQRNTVVIPKSADPERMKKNITVRLKPVCRGCALTARFTSYS